MHNMPFKYQNNARHSGMTYSVSLDLKADGKVYVPARGPLRGTYCEDACALVIAEELGARPEESNLLCGNQWKQGQDMPECRLQQTLSGHIGRRRHCRQRNK
jgi:hypothetical protein